MPPAVGQNLGLHLGGSPHFLSELTDLLAEDNPAYAILDIETLGKAAAPGSVTAVGIKTPKRAYTFYGGKVGKPRLTLNQREAATILQTLEGLQKKGTKVVGWNTSGFDFQQLAHKSGLFQTAARLARTTYDYMFQLLSEKGYPAALEKVGEAIGIQKRTDIDPAVSWAQGRYQETLDRLVGDLDITEAAHLQIEREGGFHRITKTSGKRLFTRMTPRTPEELLATTLPPDTSWMKEASALTRESAIAWTTKKRLVDADMSVAWATATAAGRTYTSDDVTAIFMNKVQRTLRHNKTAFMAAGAGLGIIGAAALVGKLVSRPAKAPRDKPIPFPEAPMPIGAVEDQALIGLASMGMAPPALMHAEGLMPEQREEGLHSIGDFGKWFKEIFYTGKAGLVQELHKNACKAGIRDPKEKYWSLGNCAPPYSPPAQHPVRSRAGVL